VKRTINRREFGAGFLVATAVALPALPRLARAQGYPTRPVRVLEEFGAGGTPDMVARLMSQWLSERLGQPFIVENRTGAGGNIATEAAAAAPPDGYTLLTCTSANAVNATLYDKLKFDFVRDIAPVAGPFRTPMVMLVNPSFPAKTLPEFIAYAKANPGKINIAAPGNGSPMHVAGELFKMLADVQMLDVPYRGSPPVYADLLAGQIQVTFISVPSALGYIKAGSLRALAVTSAARADVLPDIPSVGEFVPGFEASSWSGIGAPRNTPTEIINTLNTEINAGLADPRIKAHLADVGAVPTPTTPQEFGKFIREEKQKWAEVIKFANIKAE
jgi:tripartite-type tricarboxylate transporter receptor subunit TctC